MATKGKALTDRMKIELLAAKLGCEFTSKVKVVTLAGRRLVFNDAGEIVKVQEIVTSRGGDKKYVTVSQSPEHEQATGEGV